jgi:hypothetical protein
MTVPLTNLLPNSSAFSVGAGDLCPDSMVKAPKCQCRDLKHATTEARASVFTGLSAFPRPAARLTRTTRWFEKPFKPNK